MKYNFSQRSAGLLIPSFALRHDGDLGIGDVESVRQLILWAAEQRLQILQFLPLNETSRDNSPYNAISSKAICPTTLDIRPETIPWLNPDDYHRILGDVSLSSLRSGPVQYDRVKPLKLDLLSAAFLHFHDDPDFEKFLEEHTDWLEYYSMFRLLVELHGDSSVWDLWPVEHQSFESATLWLQAQPNSHDLSRRMMFYCFVQWIALRQWQSLKQLAQSHGVLLMGDIPFGVSRYSADVWAHRQLFDLRWSGGAPPEPYFKDDPFVQKWGQNWGIPLYAWEVHERDNYGWWKSRLSYLESYVDLVRIDHVLGFYRIFAFPWAPHQNADYLPLSPDEARSRAGDIPRFVPGPDHEPYWSNINKTNGFNRLKELSEAVPRLTLVAEDLGFVPDYVRPSLLELEIPGFKIPIFERVENNRQLKDSNSYHTISVATLATHDHLPMLSLWQSLQQQKLEGPDQEGARYEQQCLLQWIGWTPDQLPSCFTPALHLELCHKLWQCSSSIAILQISDWFGTSHRFNVPGPVSNSNWSARLDWTVKDFSLNPDLQAISQKQAGAIRETKRSKQKE